MFNAVSSALSIPLLELNGGMFGVLTLYSAASAAFSKDHLRILQAIELQFSLSLQNALRFRIAETDAKIDTSRNCPTCAISSRRSKQRSGKRTKTTAICGRCA